MRACVCTYVHARYRHTKDKDRHTDEPPTAQSAPQIPPQKKEKKEKGEIHPHYSILVTRMYTPCPRVARVCTGSAFGIDRGVILGTHCTATAPRTPRGCLASSSRRAWYPPCPTLSSAPSRRRRASVPRPAVQRGSLVLVFFANRTRRSTGPTEEEKTRIL